MRVIRVEHGKQQVWQPTEPIVCPGLFYAVPAHDGIILRVRTPGGLLSSQQSAVVAHCTAQHGDGSIQITHRANLQIRTVRTVPPDTVLAMLQAAGLASRSAAVESLTALAAHRASLCLFLSARLSKKVQDQLLTAYAPDTPVAILYRVSWPDEKIIVTRLQELHSTIRQHHLTRTTLILVGEALGGGQHRSRLYHATHGHIFRSRSRPGRDADTSETEHGAGSPRHAPASGPAEATP